MESEHSKHGPSHRSMDLLTEEHTKRKVTCHKEEDANDCCDGNKGTPGSVQLVSRWYKLSDHSLPKGPSMFLVLLQRKGTCTCS